MEGKDDTETRPLVQEAQIESAFTIYHRQATEENPSVDSELLTKPELSSEPRPFRGNRIFNKDSTQSHKYRMICKDGTSLPVYDEKFYGQTWQEELW